jgi:hypothetical protein
LYFLPNNPFDLISNFKLPLSSDFDIVSVLNNHMKSTMSLNPSNGHANYMAIEMPTTKQHSHRERHSAGSEYLESAVLGMADGLTVPFALTAGLSSYAQHIFILIFQ